MYIKRYFNFINESNNIDKVYNNINWSLEKEDVEGFFYNLKDLANDDLKIDVYKGFAYISEDIYFSEEIMPEGKLYWLIKIKSGEIPSFYTKSKLVDLTEYFELAIKVLEEFMGNKSKIQDIRGSRIVFSNIKFYNSYIENMHVPQDEVNIYIEDPNKYEFSYKDYLDYYKITYNQNNIEKDKLFAEIDIKKLAELTILRLNKFNYNVLVNGYDEKFYNQSFEYVSSHHFLNNLSNDNIKKLIKNFINDLGYNKVLEYIDDDDIENEDELIDFLLFKKKQLYYMMSNEDYILLKKIKHFVINEHSEYLKVYVCNEMLNHFNEELKKYINFEFKENTRTYKVYFDNTIYKYISDGVIDINNFKNLKIEDVIIGIINHITVSFRGLSLDTYPDLNKKRLNDKIKLIL